MVRTVSARRRNLSDAGRFLALAVGLVLGFLAGEFEPRLSRPIAVSQPLPPAVVTAELRYGALASVRGEVTPSSPQAPWRPWEKGKSR